MADIHTDRKSQHTLKRPIDDKLISDIAKGNMSAFHDLYTAVSGNVYGFALSITKNIHDAQDVLQDTFLKVYSNADRYIPNGKPLAWIFTITRNLSLDKIKDKMRSSEYCDNIREEIDFSVIENTEHRLLLEKMFDILNDEEKQILILHSVNGMKHREIAKLLSIPLNTVLSKYNRAVNKLKKAIEEEDY